MPRGDIGGFGAGADVKRHFITTLRRRLTDRLGWYIGYRIIAFDYEDCSRQDHQHYA